MLTDTKNSNTKKEHKKGDITKREIVADSELLEPAPELSPNGLQSEVVIEPNNNCLLTRLLRQSGPYYYGNFLIYPKPSNYNIMLRSIDLMNQIFCMIL